MAASTQIRAIVWGTAVTFASIAWRATKAQGGVPRTPADSSVRRTAALAGVVRDATGRPIRMAAVLVEGTDRSAVTDDSGRFHVDRVPAGKNDFTVRRIGYTVVEFATTLAPDSTLVLGITMTPLTTLDAVRISAAREIQLERVGFSQRQHMGLGSFVTPARVDSLPAAQQPSALLRGVRGVEVVCTSPAGPCKVGTRRPPNCLNIFVNGAQMDGQLDDNVMVGEVYAMEVYENPTVVPTEFQGRLPTKTGRGVTAKAGCGAIAVWTNVRMRR